VTSPAAWSDGELVRRARDVAARLQEHEIDALAVSPLVLYAVALESANHLIDSAAVLGEDPSDVLAQRDECRVGLREMLDELLHRSSRSRRRPATCSRLAAGLLRRHRPRRHRIRRTHSLGHYRDFPHKPGIFTRASRDGKPRLPSVATEVNIVGGNREAAPRSDQVDRRVIARRRWKLEAEPCCFIGGQERVTGFTGRHEISAERQERDGADQCDPGTNVSHRDLDFKVLGLTLVEHNADVPAFRRTLVGAADRGRLQSKHLARIFNVRRLVELAPFGGNIHEHGADRRRQRVLRDAHLPISRFGLPLHTFQRLSGDVEFVSDGLDFFPRTSRKEIRGGRKRSSADGDEPIGERRPPVEPAAQATGREHESGVDDRHTRTLTQLVERPAGGGSNCAAARPFQ
jgi:hypothetical protein